jgi:hypothetical protein
MGYAFIHIIHIERERGEREREGERERGEREGERKGGERGEIIMNYYGSKSKLFLSFYIFSRSDLKTVNIFNNFQH